MLDDEDTFSDSELAELKDTADKGDPDAQCTYGLYLIADQGKESEGMEYIKRAALNEQPEAQFRYGLHLQDNGHDFEGMQFIEKAVINQYPDAQFYYALWLEERYPSGDLQRMIIELIQLAADQGQTQAQIRYGQCLASGDGVERHIAKAGRYFKAAADTGDPDGQLSYGLYLHDQVRDRETAVKYFELSAKQGYHEAEFFLGAALLLGEGIKPDKRQAVQYFHKSALGKDPKGRWAYGFCLMNGEGIEMDLEEGARFLKLSAEAGDDKGQYLYALCLLEGDGVNFDITLAREFLEESASSRFENAKNVLGILLATGAGGERDLKRAQQLLDSASKKNTLCGKYNRAVLGLYTKAMKMSLIQVINDFKKICKSDTQQSYDYREVLGENLGVDNECRWRFVLAEATNGCPNAMYMYGQHLYAGRQVDKALDFFERSAAKVGKFQNPCKTYRKGLGLGNFVYASIRFHEKKCPLSEVEEHFKIACSSGVCAAQFSYGEILEKGSDSEGRSPDLERAARYFQMAAEHVLLRRETRDIHVHGIGDRDMERLYYNPYPFVLSQLAPRPDGSVWSLINKIASYLSRKIDIRFKGRLCLYYDNDT